MAMWGGLSSLPNANHQPPTCFGRLESPPHTMMRLRKLSKKLRKRYKAASRSVRYWLGSQILKALLAILPLFPLAFLERVGRAMGSLARRIMRESRELASSNLRLALPDLSEDERSRIGKAAAQNLLINAFQVVWMVGHRREMRELIEIDGLEHVADSLKSGNGTILLGAHFGNFILQCLRLGSENFTFSTIVNMPKAKGLSSIITRKANEMGLNIIPRRRAWAATRETINRLSNNEVVCVIADEEARKGGVFVDFFGHQVPTPKGPAQLALRSGADVLPVFIYRLGGARQRIVIEPPLQIPRDDTEDMVEGGTAIMAKAIEGVVREHPEEWAWITHRWRKRRRKRDDSV